MGQEGGHLAAFIDLGKLGHSLTGKSRTHQKAGQRGTTSNKSRVVSCSAPPVACAQRVVCDMSLFLALPGAASPGTEAKTPTAFSLIHKTRDRMRQLEPHRSLAGRGT